MAWTVLTHGGLPRRFLRPFSARASVSRARVRSEEHTSELQSRENLVCRLPLEKKKTGRAHCRVWPCLWLIPVQAHLRYPFGASRCLDHSRPSRCAALCFFFNDTATTEIYTLSLHDALPI